MEYKNAAQGTSCENNELTHHKQWSILKGTEHPKMREIQPQENKLICKVVVLRLMETKLKPRRNRFFPSALQ